MSTLPADLRIATLQRLYRSGTWTPLDTVEALIARLAEPDAHHIWIERLSAEALRAHARALAGRNPDDLPLYGVPFAIKDNIDLAGVPTTAACPAFAYTPARSAFVVQRLIDAGAIPVGKTNLDQFATGLNGTRSPYGACRNAFDPDFIAGGSSSGSAVAVALGLASFSLGTDTAGSGRVPASFNNLVGLKPTCGALSNSGVVPACRSLDSVSVFALTADDAEAVLDVAQAFDPADPFSRPGCSDASVGARFRFGVPRAGQLEFFGDAGAAALFAATVDGLREVGGEAVEIDLEPFLETARLLYEGPWVAERYAAVGEFIESQPESVLPVTRGIILGGKVPSAVEAFRGLYRLRALEGRVEEAFGEIDVLLTPTAGTIYRIAEMDADPVRLNTQLGHYTNFMNLLDLAAVAVPAGFRADGLPWGVTLCAPAGSDRALLALARRWQQHARLPLGATGVVPSPATDAGTLQVAVVGAHLSGLPLNGQLIERGARRVAATRTAPRYRLYALPDGKRPGLVRVEDDGAAIECEVWEMPACRFGSFVAGITAPLGIGKLELADGSWVSGFICEGIGVAGARDITEFGGWRAWLARGPSA
jgi:allophanate hydrolase